MANAATNNGAKRGAAEDTRLGRLAGWCFDHRRMVLGLWLVALVVSGIASGAVGTQFSNSFGGGGSESARAQTLLQERFPSHSGATVNVVFHADTPLSAPANGAKIDSLTGELSKLPGVAAVAPPDPSQGLRGQTSADGHTAFATVTFDADIGNLENAQVAKVVDTARAADSADLQVEVGGQPVALVEQPEMGSSEIIGILAAIVILLVAFGSVIAMGLPIMTALFGLGIGVSLLAFVSHVLDTPSFAPQMAIMIALGVGIDYALFIVTRHREVLHGGATPRHAAVTALATSGRAVLFAGSTVVISLLGMFLLGMSFIYGVAIGAIAAVVMVMLGSITLLPAMLGFAGPSIDRFGIQRFLHRGEGDVTKTYSYRWSRFVQRRPIALGGAALLVLLVLAIPLFSMQQSFSDQGNDPTSLTTRRAYDLLAAGFGPGFNGPLVVAVDLPSPADKATAAKLQAAIQRDPGVAVVAPPQFNDAGNTATVLVVPKTSPQNVKTEILVHRLRDQVIPAAVTGTGVEALVGGITAASVDAAAHLTERLPWVIGGVVLLSFLLLMSVFRSLVVPLKAAVMNLLSIGAAYGIIVAIFQWGWFKGAIGV
ncbi:MAG TPA: MMPL family transporter, partial [Acidimicrobiales bacterium]|nr:MMPL family transporter [Acidimicrobiales bacterium]